MGTDPRSSLGDFGGMRMGSTLDFETKHRREFRRDNTTNAGIFPIELNFPLNSIRTQQFCNN